jgi:D-ribose pyranose/furanose isomerase RbsD
LKIKPSYKDKEKSTPGPHPLHIAKKFQNQLEAGSVNKADLARQHGMSRARVTQIMNLLNLESKIKEEILNMSQSEQRYFTERKLRKIVRLSSSNKQLQAFEHLKLVIK